MTAKDKKHTVDAKALRDDTSLPRVDGLWRVYDKTRVVTPAGPVMVYMRTITALEDDARRREANADGRTMRLALLNEETQEHKRHMAQLYVASREAIEDLLMQFQQVETMRRSFVEVFSKDEPQPPKNATIVQVLEVEEQVEKIADDVAEARREWVEKQLDAYRTDLSAKSQQELIDDAKNRLIANITAQTIHSRFDYETMHYACFRDEAYTERLFATVEDAMGCNPDVLPQLVLKYMDLDRWSQEPEELKK